MKLLKYVHICVSITAICALVFLSCSEDESEFKQLIEETQPVAERETVDRILDKSEAAIKDSSIAYNDNIYDWSVKYEIFSNEHHPNGYVMIQKIQKSDADSREVWVLDYDASNYVAEIHYNIKATYNNESYEEDNVFLPSDYNFRCAFRTAEAIFIAWDNTSKNPVDMADVSDAARRMEGRQHGVSR